LLTEYVLLAAVGSAVGLLVAQSCLKAFLVLNGLRGPVDILGVKRCNVGLGSAQMPAQFIKSPAFWISFPFDNSAVLFERDGPLFAKLYFGPMAADHDRPQEPVHVQREIVYPPEVNVRADGAGIDCFKDVFGLGLHQCEVAERVEGAIFGSRLPTIASIISLGVDDGVQYVLPRALGQRGIACGQVSLGDHQVYMRSVLGFVARVNEALSFTFIGGLEGLLFAGLGIFDVVGAPAAAEQTETVFHFVTHIGEPTAAGRNFVSEQ
jgi:hypothetical protein